MSPYDTPLIDPRPLAPPDPPPDPEPEPYWHLLSADHEHEDYAYSEDELHQLLPRYQSSGPFTVQLGTYLPDA
jgi:hypothetical protein